jgi:hypothetical protein
VFEGCSFYQGCRRIAPASDGERAIPLHPCAIDRPRPSCILRLSLAAPQLVARSGEFGAAGAESNPRPTAYKADALPLSYGGARLGARRSCGCGLGGWIRTSDLRIPSAAGTAKLPHAQNWARSVGRFETVREHGNFIAWSYAVVNPSNDKKARQPSGISRQSPVKSQGGVKRDLFTVGADCEKSSSTYGASVRPRAKVSGSEQPQSKRKA